MRSTKSHQRVALQCLTTPGGNSPLAAVGASLVASSGMIVPFLGSGSCCGTRFLLWDLISAVGPDFCCSPLSHQLGSVCRCARTEGFSLLPSFLALGSQRPLWDTGTATPGSARLGRSSRTPKLEQQGGTAKCKLPLHKAAAHQTLRKSRDVFFQPGPRGRRQRSKFSLQH